MTKIVTLLSILLISQNSLKAQKGFNGYLTITNKQCHYIDNSDYNNVRFFKTNKDSKLTFLQTHLFDKKFEYFTSTMINEEQVLCLSSTKRLAILVNGTLVRVTEEQLLDLVKSNSTAIQTCGNEISFLKIPVLKNEITVLDTSINFRLFGRKLEKPNLLYQYSPNISMPQYLFLNQIERRLQNIFFDVVFLEKNKFMYFLYYTDIHTLESGVLEGEVKNPLDGFIPKSIMEQDSTYVKTKNESVKEKINFSSNFKAIYINKQIYLVEDKGNMYVYDKDKGINIIKKRYYIDFANAIWIENRDENYVAYIHLKDFNKEDSVEKILSKAQKILIE